MARRPLTSLGLLAAAFSLNASPPSVLAQATPTTFEQRAAAAAEAHLNFLSHDLLGGRATGTPGGDIAAQYIAAAFRRAGLAPGAPNGTYLQPVSLIALNPRPSIVFGIARRTSMLRFGEDFVAWPMVPDSAMATDGQISFVGFGVVAPETQWDDYGGEPLNGQVALILPGDPGFADSAVFSARTRTRYGTWRYKLEQAARMGAIGALLIHSTRDSEFPWSVVRNLFAGEILQPDPPPTGTLRFAGWITEDAASRLVSSAGIDYDVMVRRAAQPTFRPIPTGIHAAIDIPSRVRRIEGFNVIARLGDPTTQSPVVVTAHYDHLGARPQGADSVFNGAVDNASGVTAMLLTAEALTLDPPATPVVFAATTAGEPFHLGAAALMRSGFGAGGQARAVIELHQPNVWGNARDISLDGDESLVPLVDEAVVHTGVRDVWKRDPTVGAVYLSDAWQYIRGGVPAVVLQSGQDFADRPEGWGARRLAAYRESLHLRPADEVSEDFRYLGLVQSATFVWEMIRAARLTPGTP